MSKQEMICIICPMGCRLELSIIDGRVDAVGGNECPRGVRYAHKEYENPTRTLTTTVKVCKGSKNLVPVKSNGELPKDLIMKCMDTIRATAVDAPVKMGQVIVENIMGLGVDIIATSEISKAEPSDRC